MEGGLIEAHLNDLIAKNPEAFAKYISRFPYVLNRAIESSPIVLQPSNAAPAAPLITHVMPSTVHIPVPEPHRFIKAATPTAFSGNNAVYFQWRSRVKLFLRASLLPAEIQTPYSVTVIGTFMEGNALDWFDTNSEYFTCPDELFKKYEEDYNIMDRAEVAYNDTVAVCNQPWKGSILSYLQLVEPLLSAAEPCMTDNTGLRLIMYPLPKEIKDFVLLPIHRGTLRTWKDARTLIMDYLNTRNTYDRLPSSDAITQLLKTQSTGPVPMEVGAVTTPGKTRTPAPASKVSAHDFWKDKICMACGQKGHSKNYKGCPKHPEYKPKPKAKTYAAAVGAGSEDQDRTVASTSATVTTSAAADPMAAMQAQLDDMKAMMASMTSNC
jgi:hypothetical protein